MSLLIERKPLDVPFAFQCGLPQEAAPTCYDTTMFDVVHLIGVEEHVYCAQMGRLRLFAIDEDAEKKVNILLCEDLQKNGLAARMRPSNNALKSYVGVVASRSRRQAETKQQRTAAAVVTTMTQYLSLIHI